MTSSSPPSRPSKTVCSWRWSRRIGTIETREGGLQLREREEFMLTVPEDFPFQRPWRVHP